MARYMWICQREQSPSEIRYQIEERMEPAVLRVFNSQKRSCWAFITNKATYEWAKEAGLADTSLGPWSITSCNKQYVADEGKKVYLGCLAEVRSNEAHNWTFADEANWYLRKPGEDIYWLPVMRNPNKFIPTVGNRLWPKQERNWPLKSAFYEEWRDEIVNKMIKALDKIL